MQMIYWVRYLPGFALASSAQALSGDSVHQNNNQQVGGSRQVNLNEYYFKEGCFIQEWHNSPDDEAMSIARVRVELGATTKLHCLKDTTERYAILSGTGVVSVAGQDRSVKDGDVVTIAPGEAQRITNTGPEELLFLAICTPRFREENYRQLED